MVINLRAFVSRLLYCDALKSTKYNWLFSFVLTRKNARKTIFFTYRVVFGFRTPTFLSFAYAHPSNNVYKYTCPIFLVIKYKGIIYEDKNQYRYLIYIIFSIFSLFFNFYSLQHSVWVWKKILEFWSLLLYIVVGSNTWK